MPTPTTTYRTNLIQRFWAYQKSHFPDWQAFFDRPESPTRPPVFLPSQAWRNVITHPGTGREGIARLLPPNQHKWFRSMSSSQALAQSVLGNLAVHGLLPILAELTDDDGQPLMAQAQLTADHFAMEAKVSHLGERRSTTLDGYISGRYPIAIECKFTEHEVGSCSRPRLSPQAAGYCDGNYTRQANRTGRCPLTTSGVRYWHHVPALFRWQNDVDLSPCPLDKNYQLVRNILAVGVRPDGTVSPEAGHVLLIYDARNPAFQPGGKAHTAYVEVRSALHRPGMLRKCSWQRITTHLRQHGLLPWLTQHLALKYGL